MEHIVKSKSCPQCNNEFSYRWPKNNKFCSRKCTLADYRNRHREEINAYSRNRPKEIRRGVCKRYDESKKGKAKAKEFRERYAPVIAAKSAQKYSDDEHYRALLATRMASNRILKNSEAPYICSKCPVNKRLHCHHIDLNPFNRDLSNLMWLCHWCHMRVHAEIRNSPQ